MPNNLKALRCNGLRMLVYDFYGVGFVVWRTQTTFSGPAFKTSAVVPSVLNYVLVIAGPRFQVPKREVTIPAKRYQVGGFQFQFRRDVYRNQVVGFKVSIRAACQTIGALQGSVAEGTPPRGPRRPEDHSHGAGE